MTDPYQLGRRFYTLFGDAEFALKRAGFLKAKVAAEADWNAYAQRLGADFFNRVRVAGIAPTLINDPPRKLMANGLQWVRKNDDPLANVDALVIEGICRVRNSYFHGEKFTGTMGAEQWERDLALVTESLAVLELAVDAVPEVAKLVRAKSGHHE